MRILPAAHRYRKLYYMRMRLFLNAEYSLRLTQLFHHAISAANVQKSFQLENQLNYVSSHEAIERG